MYTKSCDAGERWTFTNAVGNPIRVWDSLDHVIRSVYDELHRHTELCAECTIYGEGQTDPEDSNLRGKVYQVNDRAGVVTNHEYDFKGNLVSTQRQLAQEYITQLDWSDTAALEMDIFTQETVYDALNRPTRITTPDGSVVIPEYNEAGLLEGVEAHVRGAPTPTVFVDDIEYDAKGQRERIEYGNGKFTREWKRLPWMPLPSASVFPNISRERRFGDQRSAKRSNHRSNGQCGLSGTRTREKGVHRSTSRSGRVPSETCDKVIRNNARTPR
ncbi:MAG: RHS repeat protein [Polyangiaceae bacterium]|nr:RHS repeat protein [Polyangiaceae bacterium]